MIVYRCDRCAQETAPDKLFDVELIFTPRGLDGGEDTDKEDRNWLGQLCQKCADVFEAQVRTLVKATTSTEPGHNVGWGDKREKSG